MRFLQLVLWGVLLALTLRILLRPRRGPGPRSRRAPDVLVKDPVCQAYILRSRALTRVEDGVLHHFCSPACARQFVHGGSGSRG
jgi:YHS domain-containing protein